MTITFYKLPRNLPKKGLPLHGYAEFCPQLADRD